jgi:hypothetical protein
MSFAGLGEAFIGKDHLTQVCSHLTHLRFQYDVILTAVNVWITYSVWNFVIHVFCLCVHVFCLEFCDSRILSGIFLFHVFQCLKFCVNVWFTYSSVWNFVIHVFQCLEFYDVIFKGVNAWSAYCGTCLSFCDTGSDLIRRTIQSPYSNILRSPHKRAHVSIGYRISRVIR